MDYSYGQLKSMISASAVSETEIFQITVTARDPREAAKIANCISEILPKRVADIIDGASMEVVDSAVPDLQRVAPSITKYTAIGLILGAVITYFVMKNIQKKVC